MCHLSIVYQTFTLFVFQVNPLESHKATVQMYSSRRAKLMHVDYCDKFRFKHPFCADKFTNHGSAKLHELLRACVLAIILPSATWTPSPSFVIFQSTSTPTAPQLTSVNSRLLLATARDGQRSSSLGGSVTVTSPRAETWTWTHASVKRNIQIGHICIKINLSFFNLYKMISYFFSLTSLCPAQAIKLTK